MSVKVRKLKICNLLIPNLLVAMFIIINLLTVFKNDQNPKPLKEKRNQKRYDRNKMEQLNMKCRTNPRFLILYDISFSCQALLLPCKIQAYIFVHSHELFVLLIEARKVQVKINSKRSCSLDYVLLIKYPHLIFFHKCKKSNSRKNCTNKF